MTSSEVPLTLGTVQYLSSLSAATLYRKIAAGTFPKPTKQGRRNVWDEAEMTRWLLDPEHYRAGHVPCREEVKIGPSRS